jgi:hypothetical protein
MPSVRELKDAALADQQNAAEVVATAMDAIDTLLSISQYVLAIFGGSLAILALVGVVIIYRAAERAAEKIAKKRFDAHIESSVFDEKLDARIKHALDVQKENEAAKGLNVEDDGEPSEFEAPPQGTHRNDTI